MIIIINNNWITQINGTSAMMIIMNFKDCGKWIRSQYWTTFAYHIQIVEWSLFQLLHLSMRFIWKLFSNCCSQFWKCFWMYLKLKFHISQANMIYFVIFVRQIKVKQNKTSFHLETIDIISCAIKNKCKQQTSDK